MPKKIAVQLYSVRQYAQQDFVDALKKIADIGYTAVEPASFLNLRPSEFKKIVNDLGMEVCSSFAASPRVPFNMGEAMELADILGLKTIIFGYGRESFADLDTIKATAENTCKMMEVLKRNGYDLVQHNHYWEFDRIDGRLKYDIYRELCPGIKFELDCFWSTNNGKEDAVEILNKYADDVVAIHMKDGVCTQETNADGEKNYKVDLMPLGSGELPIPQLVAAIPERVKHIIIELDYCNIEMFEALKRSYDYMTQNNFAVGNK